VSINTLHKGDDDNNNNNKILPMLQSGGFKGKGTAKNNFLIKVAKDESLDVAKGRFYRHLRL
jgi:hypothetical protein